MTLDDQRRGSAAFNVSNTSGKALKGRVSLESVPGGAPHASWLKLIGDPEQQFDIAILGNVFYFNEYLVPNFGGKTQIA